MRGALLPLLLATTLAACGGDDSEPKSAAETATTTAPADPAARREVAATVDGRKITGHCVGAAKGEPPVVLDSGIGNTQDQLQDLEDKFAKRTVVCGYDRAGVGGSDPPAKTPRKLDEVVEDLDAFIDAAKLEPPVALVGQSAGATSVFMYAQAHPDKVAGFVSMNPVPPAKTWLKRARKVETKDEYETDEVAFYNGENDEEIDFNASEGMLSAPLPAKLPYAVMFDENCDGDTDFCGRILAPLTAVTKSLADVGRGGRFVRAKDAGHEIYATQPDLVYETVDGVLSDARDGG